MATGKNDFLWCSVVHLGAISLDQSVVERVRATLQYCPNFDSNTAGKVSSSTPTMSLAFLISLLSLLASATRSLLPQHTMANRIALATTDTENILSIVRQMLK